MKNILTLSCVAVGLSFGTAAFAQTAPTAAKTPTMDQCKAGYKADYMKSMNWSKATFDSACKTMMMKK